MSAHDPHDEKASRMPNSERRFDVKEALECRSEAMADVLKKVRSVAPTRTTVLLRGETGVGKGVFARLLHFLSNRTEQRFVTVHCGAIPDTLIESELFGHEKGAFTGAQRRKQGRFELADAGTLFLDEVGTITAATQIKLLDVLQERRFQRVGGEKEIEIDVRLLAATNSNLEELTQAGSFRSDLFYRLHVFPIDIPPLRDRVEDIELLSRRMLDRLNQFNLKNIDTIHPDVMAALCAYPWPGNVRELENILERAFILEETDTISPDSIPVEILKASEATASVPIDASRTLREVRDAAIELSERRYLIELLQTWSGRIGESASAAGITTRQLHKLLTRHGIRKEEFKRPGLTGRGTRLHRKSENDKKEDPPVPNGDSDRNS